VLAATAIALGFIGGFLSGGAFKGLAELRIRYEWAVLISFLVQGVARGRLEGTTASPWATAVWTSISVMLAILLFLNRRAPGALIAGAGVLINVDVVLANHGMPVVVDASNRALTAVGNSGGFYHVAGPATVLAWAGDVLRFQAFGGLELVSVGDVLLVVGVAVIVAQAMLESHDDVGSAQRPISA